jgi:alcohol dehydrogenase class IV
MPVPFQLRQPRFVYCGSDAVGLIPELLKRFASSRSFVVLDQGLVNTPVAARLCELLPATTKLFTETTPDPSVDLVDSVTSVARAHGADLVIGVGGGSAMDLAKAVSVLVSNPDSAAEYQGFDLVKRAGVPKIMIPSTTGSGAEATWSAVLVNRQLGKKGGINSPYILPDVAILDPLITMSAPRSVALSSCVDALTHAIESYTAKNATPMSRVCSDAALRLILGSIVEACDPSARTEGVMLNMLQGSYWAAVAIGGSETGPCHALGYPLGVRFAVPHGLANALLLPHVMEFNVSRCVEVYALVAELLEPGTASLDREASARRAPSLISGLFARLGLEVSLRSFGITADQLSDLAVQGLQLRGPLENAPRPLDIDNAREIYRKSLDPAPVVA